LKDSQHIGQSRPSSLLVHEETSSSEQSGFEGCAFFFKLPAIAFDAKLHMMPSQNKPEKTMFNLGAMQSIVKKIKL
jgi:hypothetical protein